jgi:hypothetical protein
MRSSPQPAGPSLACATASSATTTHHRLRKRREGAGHADWIETAVDTGKVDVDGELAPALAG